jgi:DNA-binding CsgD family transcriptional regulator
MLDSAEALRLLASASAGTTFPGAAAEHNERADPGRAAHTPADDCGAVLTATWDAALVQTQVAEVLSGVDQAPASAAGSTASTIDPTALSSGLAQLNKYLSRAWRRAGIPGELHEDSSQTVFATLLQRQGRDRFDALLSGVGHSGIKNVFTRETDEGVDFFRAVDMAKKRVQRERDFKPLGTADLPESSDDLRSRTRHEALREAIDQSLTRREAGLIDDTLMGKTPAEIAIDWGAAPKTVSNEKTRVIQKLREALLASEAD